MLLLLQLHQVKRDYGMNVLPVYIGLGRPTYLSADIYFTGIFLLLFISLSNLRARWTELSHIRPHGQKYISAIKKNTCPKSEVSPSPTNWGPKTAFFRQLRNAVASLATYSLYLPNKTWYRQSVQCVDNHKGPPMSHQNINFGPQTASNSSCIFTHPTRILLSTSLPGFADGHQQTELNQTLPNGGR